MPGSELLAIIAEVSIVFAGFTGVVATLGFRDSAQPNWSHLLHVGGMVGFSLIAALFALIPLLLSELGLSDVTAWRASSIGLASAMVVWQTLGELRFRNVAQLGHRDPSLRRFLLVVSITTALVALALFSSAVGLLAQAGGVYMTCLFVSLAFAALWFVRVFLAATLPPAA